ncbi:MAG: DUF411 domain-containing protein [Gemmatimonadaceae bacterium]
MAQPHKSRRSQSADRGRAREATQAAPRTVMMSRRAWLGAAAGAAALLGVRWWRGSAAAAMAGPATAITVYASPTCGCCHKWVAHLEDNQFKVTVENLDPVAPMKRELGVPENLWSCHTARVEGYAVEGHVPADLIRKMIAERPAIAGIAAPGMPNGSPGMEGATKDFYEVIAFTRTGATEVYAVR